MRHPGRTGVLRRLRMVVVAGLCVLASACAQAAKPGAMTPVSAPTVSADNAFATQIVRAEVSGGQETSPLWTSEIGGPEFQIALENALRASGFLSATGKHVVSAQLLSVDQPFAGISMTVTSTVRYLVNAPDGATVFDETVTAPYTAQFGDSLYGVERLRLANEGSARENIAAFIKKLEAKGAETPRPAVPTS